MKTLFFAVLTTAFLIVCMLFLDRPIADFFYRLFGQTRYRWYLDMSLIPIALSLIPLVIGYLWATKTPDLGRTLLLAAAGIVLALAAVVALKGLFGRSCVDPVYLYEHKYGFQPLAWVHHWDAFPSGTASVAWVVASILSLSVPRLKRAATVLACLACLVVLAVNAHWLSDLVAGTLLGTGLGRLTVRYGSPLIRRRPVCV